MTEDIIRNPSQNKLAEGRSSRQSDKYRRLRSKYKPERRCTERSQLKQFGDLKPIDFNRYPVWIGCHTVGVDQPLYSETNEETFRPWNGLLPVKPPDGLFLVRAQLKLRDGSVYPGFLTPALELGDLGAQQPHMFVDDHCFGFWGGIVGIAPSERLALYAALCKTADLIFPIRFNVAAGLATGAVTGQVNGFYQCGHQCVRVEY